MLLLSKTLLIITNHIKCDLGEPFNIWNTGKLSMPSMCASFTKGFCEEITLLNYTSRI